ncbi:hypothetical protein [Gemmata sp.]|uniref:hypothetical protein n=1 Tax=Gemmata sp. TaxID=1914242 RepID=UPI003F711DAD
MSEAEHFARDQENKNRAAAVASARRAALLSVCESLARSLRADSDVARVVRPEHVRTAESELPPLWTETYPTAVLVAGGRVWPDDWHGLGGLAAELIVEVRGTDRAACDGVIRVAEKFTGNPTWGYFSGTGTPPAREDSPLVRVVRAAQFDRDGWRLDDWSRTAEEADLRTVTGRTYDPDTAGYVARREGYWKRADVFRILIDPKRVRT